MPQTPERLSDPPRARGPQWHALEAEEAAAKLDSDAARGLSAETAAARLREYGPNQLKEVGRQAWWLVLVRQFNSVLILILLAAAALSLALGKFGDAATILAIVALNGVLGFVQEWRAERAMEALKRMLSLRTTVIRGGRLFEVDARQIVPGDLVQLEIGDRVPADLRLVHVVDLRADESALTGESVSTHKREEAVPEDAALSGRGSMVYMGTTVTNGRGTGLVAATGMDTEIGRIAALTQSLGREVTPLQEKLGLLGRQLGILAIAVSALVAALGWALGRPLLDMFMTGVSLAVAAVPEGLPAVVTVTLALGIRSMIRHKVLIRRLQAAETLGAATVICTDKTGTLTENMMTVTHLVLPAGEIAVTGTGYAPRGRFEAGGQAVDPSSRKDLRALLETALSCNHAEIIEGDEGSWRARGEPTEAALVTLAMKAGLVQADRPPPAGEISFNSRRKRMTVITREQGTGIAHVKGAPEVILERCTETMDGNTVRPLTHKDREHLSSAYARLAGKGLRVLAVARRRWEGSAHAEAGEVERDLTFLGLAGMIDPPRPEVPRALKVAGEAGIRTVMVTGDAPATACAIAGQVGLPCDEALSGDDLEDLSESELAAKLHGDTVFARVSPEHKLRIIERLQEADQVVAMTGDGVNDAPALKKADIGIAMGQRGTDVAKGASDLILTDDNYASIIRAVAEGRRQYANIKKFVRYLLSSNLGEIIAILTNILMGGPLILLPVQILWMNLVTDSVTALALGAEPGSRAAMQRPPRPPAEPILDRTGGIVSLTLGAYIGLATVFLYWFYLEGGPGNDADAAARAQTVAFTGIILLEKVNVFNFRSLGQPLARIGWLRNPWLLVAAGGMIGLQAVAVYFPPLQEALHTVPLRAQDWLIIAAAALPVFILTETVKWGRTLLLERRAQATEAAGYSA